MAKDKTNSKEAEQFLKAMKQITSVSKYEILRREAEWRNAKAEAEKQKKK